MKHSLIAILIFVGATHLGLGEAQGQPSERLLDAIQQVESGESKYPANLVGDGGRALGWMQLHRPYVIDAKEYDKSLSKFTYEEICHSRELSRRATIAYLTRYGGKNVSDEVGARLHNGGCGFRKKTGKPLENLNRYWEKVRKILERSKGL